MLPLPSSPVPVAAAAVLIGLAAARVLRNGPEPGATRWRQAAVHALPAIATATIAVVVWTTPAGVWARAAAGTLGVAVVSAPFVNGLRVPHRPPTRAEAIALERVPGDPGEDVHVADTCGRITGYAAGNPLTGTVVVSAGALAALPPQAVAALVAHERAHLERHHALLRAGTSAAVLAAGIGFLAATLSGGTAIGIGVVAILAGERLLAAAIARRTEFAADAAAARRRSPRAVVSLLSSVPAVPGDRSLPRRALFTHPSRERRLSAIREQLDVDVSRT